MNIKLTPKDFFLNIAVMAALYVSAFSFITLLFQYIDRLFPGEINVYYDPYASGISFAIASLIIVFPLYIFFVRILNIEIRKHTEKGELGLRRWLIFITLFIAGVTVAIDLIVLLNTFFSGEELTTGFLLKILTIIIVVGGVFYYYLMDLKGKWQRNETLSKTIGGIVVLLVLASIVAGFFIMGSPQTNRLIRIDTEKVSDLQNIQWQIINFWQQKETLPTTLSELEDPLTGFIVPTDPQSGEAYEYRALSGLSFELCAVFNQSSPEPSEALVRPAINERSVLYGIQDGNWQHDAGEACFERTIDPDRFPPQKAI
jgi:hypothetical protein